jgi:hypothetical protein
MPGAFSRPCHESGHSGQDETRNGGRLVFCAQQVQADEDKDKTARAVDQQAAALVRIGILSKEVHGNILSMTRCQVGGRFPLRRRAHPA